MKQYELDTRCIHLPGEDHEEHFGALSYPIYQSASFVHQEIGDESGYAYSRVQNPTRDHLEQLLASIENGTDAIAFSSGMAAETALMELFSPGDHIIAEENLYGGSTRLFNVINGKNGLDFTYLDISSTDITPYINEHTKAVFIETPTNPMMNVTDIAAVARITKEHGILLVVDNTFLSPWFQNPLDLGADVVIHSGTKYLAGHNDTLAGFIVVKDAALSQKLRFIYKTTGACLAPFDSWLIIRGMKTLALRMDKSADNASKIAAWLRTQDKVGKVYYPGLDDHPGKAIMDRQARGYGAMLSFEVESPQAAADVLHRVKLIRFAESLGGTESLLTYPLVQTHADVPKDVLARAGLTDRLLRLSVGVENADDLIRDLDQAING